MHWTSEHRALINALRGERLVPLLYQRLSRERFVAAESDVGRLRDWPASLRRDPGWPILEAALESPQGWPAAWQQAVRAGFSPRTDHHHALLFGELAEKFLAVSDYEGATYAWREGLAAWRRVFSTDYPVRLLEDLAPSSSFDVEAELPALLEPWIEARRREASEAASLGRGGEVDRRRLRFAWNALQEATKESAIDRDEFAVIERLENAAKTGAHGFSSEVITDFHRRLDALDLVEGSGDEITAAFAWFAEVFEILGRSESAVTTLVTEAVETCWALRKLERDDEPVFERIIEIATPFNEDLRVLLKTGTAAFGHNARCADMLVFRGEKESSGERRRELFEAGLEICPGHTNSAMLLSYEYLVEAEQALLQSRMQPGVLGLLPGMSERLSSHVRRADDLVALAAETYPFNKELEDYRERVRREEARLGSSASETEEENS